MGVVVINIPPALTFQEMSWYSVKVFCHFFLFLHSKQSNIGCRGLLLDFAVMKTWHKSTHYLFSNYTSGTPHVMSCDSVTKRAWTFLNKSLQNFCSFVTAHYLIPWHIQVVVMSPWIPHHSWDLPASHITLWVPFGFFSVVRQYTYIHMHAHTYVH